MLSRFCMIPERYGQTDGQTDRITISISRVSVLARDKKAVLWINLCQYVFLDQRIFLLVFIGFSACIKHVTCFQTLIFP